MRTLFLLVSLMLTLAIEVAGQGLSMSPTRLFFTGQPGETITQTVRLANSSDRDYTLSVGYKDWVRDEYGNKIYMEANSLANSNASWVSTPQLTYLVPAHEQIEVTVQMMVPENASRSKVTNSMLFFTQLPEQSDRQSTGTGIGIITLFEFGLHVYYTPPQNKQTDLEITNIEQITVAEDQGQKAAVYLHNTGNTIADATVEFELTNTATGSEVKLKSQTISMFAGAEQIVLFPMPNDLSGEYLGVSIIKIAGSNDLQVGEKTFQF